MDEIQTFPITSKAQYTGNSGHGFAGDNINTANSVDGLSMVVPYITHTTPGTSTTEYFMLNAISSLHGSNVCSSSLAQFLPDTVKVLNYDTARLRQTLKGNQNCNKI